MNNETLQTVLAAWIKSSVKQHCSEKNEKGDRLVWALVSESVVSNNNMIDTYCNCYKTEVKLLKKPKETCNY